MAEVTRVPLQPVGKGVLAKLWIGIAVLLLIAAGTAWAMKYDGVTVETVTEGEGPSPSAEDFVLINYRGMLDDGTVFDEGERVPMEVGTVVPGFAEGLQQMQAGGSYILRIPSDKAYGREGGGDVIPPDADLTFEVDLLEFRTRAQVEAMQAQMRALQMQGGPGSQMPGAPPAPPAPQQ